LLEPYPEYYVPQVIGMSWGLFIHETYHTPQTFIIALF
jgi:hypothetical protein